LGNTRLRQENAALRRELNSIVESAFDTMTRNCHLRQELLERAEAHEDAETRYRAAKDFSQAYEDLENDLEHAQKILERHGI